MFVFVWKVSAFTNLLAIFVVLIMWHKQTNQHQENGTKGKKLADEMSYVQVDPAIFELEALLEWINLCLSQILYKFCRFVKFCGFVESS